MIYDYVIIKPELNEDTLAHYGVKGMKWKKRLKGKYYSAKSKLREKGTKFNRAINMIGNDYVTTGHGQRHAITSKNQYRKPMNMEVMGNIGNKGKFVWVSTDSGKSKSSHSGQEGSRVNEGLAAGRKRAGVKSDRPLSRKKKIVSGQGTVKKRGAAK